jgi:hypothetical protein
MCQANHNIIQLAEEVSESGRYVSSSQERETTLSSRVNEREREEKGKGISMKNETTIALREKIIRSE